MNNIKNKYKDVIRIQCIFIRGIVFGRGHRGYALIRSIFRLSNIEIKLHYHNMDNLF